MLQWRFLVTFSSFADEKRHPSIHPSIQSPSNRASLRTPGSFHHSYIIHSHTSNILFFLQVRPFRLSHPEYRTRLPGAVCTSMTNLLGPNQNLEVTGRDQLRREHPRQGESNWLGKTARRNGGTTASHHNGIYGTNGRSLFSASFSSAET